MVTAMWRAHWFDGRTSRVHEAAVSLEGNAIAISRSASDESARVGISGLNLDRLAIGECFLGAPRMIGLPDGSSLQVEDQDGGFDRALRQAGYQPARAYGLMQSWRSAAVCALALIALVVWMDLQGARLFATAAVRVVPTSIDKRIGRTALAIADRRWFAPSLEPDERQAVLRARFGALVHTQYPKLDWKLEFRSTRSHANAFNAFALPDGTIVLLDQLVESMTDDEVIAVLGHELGHVVHRDVMRTLARQMGLLAVANVVWGGISAAAATTAAGLQGLHFSRDVERQADDFGVRFLERSGLSARNMADAFRVMEEEEKRTGALPQFLSDHPATGERRQAVESAARSSLIRSFAGVTLGTTAEELRRTYGPPAHTLGLRHWLYDSIPEARDGLLDVFFTPGDTDKSRRVYAVLFTPGSDRRPSNVPDLYGLTREQLVQRLGDPLLETTDAGRYLEFRDGVLAYVWTDKTVEYGVYARP